jgi:hypothetical protein
MGFAQYPRGLYVQSLGAPLSDTPSNAEPFSSPEPIVASDHPGSGTSEVKKLKVALVATSSIAATSIIIALLIVGGSSARSPRSSATATTLSPAQRAAKAAAARRVVAVAASEARHRARVAAAQTDHRAALRRSASERTLGYSTQAIEGVLNAEGAGVIHWFSGGSTSYGPALLGSTTLGCAMEIDGPSSGAKRIEVTCIPAGGGASTGLLQQYKYLKGTAEFFSGATAGAWVDQKLQEALNNLSGGNLPSIDIRRTWSKSTDEFISTNDSENPALTLLPVDSLSVYITP